MKKILIVGEKPSVCDKISQTACDTWRNHDIDIIAAMPYTNPSAQYPRGLSFSDYPLTRESVFKLSQVRFRSITSPASEWISCDLGAIDIKRYDEIVFACDHDHSGAVCFHLIIEHYFGNTVWDSIIFPSVILLSLDEESVATSFKNRGSFVDQCKVWVSYGIVKRYFDWQWNANAQVILSETLRRSGVTQQHVNPLISKYGLQLLYFIHDNPGLTYGQLCHSMAKWRGTGKYPVSENFGSCASRWAIVNQLCELGLIEASGDAKQTFHLSEVGHRFKNILHKDICDPDLPSRLEQWCMDGIDTSKHKINRYIMTFFGKQKKYLSMY